MMMVNLEVNIIADGVVIRFEREVEVESLQETFAEIGELIHSSVPTFKECRHDTADPKNQDAV
jgi:hypothetical protein